ncbi:hypothetical protein KIN20_002054 [Parelaphostrongylus tenuis]|uniref:CUB domain-containing protein n=1 Tax=Parelaphostrongylus tenuis TaxID=148309 RepID=A0AAD5QF25_PARTN|nr:hypothetical protein KIN20_002054 [Parelaphostrongylus tenuis]
MGSPRGLTVHIITKDSRNLYFQFASTSRISIKFNSDAIVEGVGFIGSVYNIDCTCNSGDHHLSEESPFLRLTTPGLLSGAPTYCPNLRCYWTIKFSTKYEIVLTISMLNLRSYMEEDVLTMTDRFGRIIFRANSDTSELRKILITSGKISLNFTSSPITGFPLLAIKSGFIIETTLLKKIVSRKKIAFTDTNFLIEISTKQFYEGLNVTYEYALTARPGNKVTIYFLTALNDVMNLNIYDGPNTTATILDPSILYANFTQDGYPLKIVSSEQHLLIQIRPNPYNINAKTALQSYGYRLATSCPPMVWSASTVLRTPAIRLSGSNCISIFHVNRDYDPSGLTTNASNLVTSGSDRQYPNLIYGLYVVMLYNSTQDNSVTYSWRKGSFATTILITPNESGIIMSEDYLPAYPLSSFKQQFSIELVAESHQMNGIRIEFLRSPGHGHGTFQFKQYNKLLEEITFPMSDGKLYSERCGNKLIIEYFSPGGTSNGLYARYRAGSLGCNSGSMALHSTTSIAVSVTVLFWLRF